MNPSLPLWRQNDAALALRNHRHPDRANMGGGADVYARWGSGMTDILERLQSLQTSLGTLWPEPNLHEEAADEITRLREELAAAQSRIMDLTKISATLNVRTSKLNALREENARLREALSYYAEEDYNGYNGSGACARAAIREGGKIKAEAACPKPDEAP